MKCVEIPNLPKNRVKTVVIGEKYTDLAKSLAERGVDSIPLPRSELLNSYENSHSDLLFCHISGNKIAICGETAANAALIEQFTNEQFNNFEITIGETHAAAEYPDDVTFNLLVFGGRYIGRTDRTDPKLAAMFKECGIEPLYVRQGYAKCSVCVVSERAAITADSGIADALEKLGCDVLRISAGGIELDGCDYGFIGGATGKIAPDKLAFTGRLDSHPDCGRILAFLAKHGVEPVWLSDRPCYDVGSIIPLIEYDCEYD